MENNFFGKMKDVYDDRKSVTENGAIGYATTGKELLDLNFAVGSLRNDSEESIQNRFAKAYFENPILAIKWLFYCMDVREGLGERRTGKVCVDWLVENREEVIKRLLKFIPEYSRWDNLFRLIDTGLKDDVSEIANKQFKEDMLNYKNGKSISLAAKWAFSVNCSNKDNKRLGRLLAKSLKLSDEEYRKMLSVLRKHIDVVERKMCAKEWSEINYEAVPSRANLIYNDAFLRNDEERRREYLGALSKGEAKINSSVLFPHDIVHKYMYIYRSLKSLDEAIEAMWKGLPDYINGKENILVVGDGSGSMYTRVDQKSGVMAVDVANALAIYFAERMSGEFANKYITFGGNPHLVDFSNCKSLRDKINLAMKNSDCSNTDINKVFKLVLDTAVKNKMSQEDMPGSILIISDMEFDSGCYFAESGHYNSRNYVHGFNRPTLFDGISREYEAYGYHLPKLIFWNVNSRTGTIPVKRNEAGVILVSGFSPAVCKIILSNKTDPYEALLETLNSKRYQPIEEAVKDII